MKNKNKNAKIQSLEIKRYRWAIKMFVVSVCLSSIFSIISQSILSTLGVVVATILILLFIAISVIFDMIGIAVTSCEEEYFLKLIREKQPGAQVAQKLCQNSEKVCSFCADVVGDICGILSGAGGACIIMTLSKNISSPSITVLISTMVSSLIAGLIIFCKAIMKGRAIKNANHIILKIGRLIERLFVIKIK